MLDIFYLVCLILRIWNVGMKDIVLKVIAFLRINFSADFAKECPLKKNLKSSRPRKKTHPKNMKFGCLIRQNNLSDKSDKIF